MKITKDMALTRKAFFETLPRALGSDAYRVDGDRVTLADGSRTLSVTFVEKPTMRLGGFAIPRADVTIAFEGYGDDQARAALERFERYFHRGGG